MRARIQHIHPNRDSQIGRFQEVLPVAGGGDFHTQQRRPQTAASLQLSRERERFGREVGVPETAAVVVQRRCGSAKERGVKWNEMNWLDWKGGEGDKGGGSTQRTEASRGSYLQDNDFAEDFLVLEVDDETHADSDDKTHVDSRLGSPMPGHSAGRVSPHSSLLVSPHPLEHALVGTCAPPAVQDKAPRDTVLHQKQSQRAILSIRAGGVKKATSPRESKWIRIGGCNPEQEMRIIGWDQGWEAVQADDAALFQVCFIEVFGWCVHQGQGERKRARVKDRSRDREGARKSERKGAKRCW